MADERKPAETPEQFYYKTRKKAWGPFKRQCWDLPGDARAQLRDALQAKFTFLFGKLGVLNTRDMVRERVKSPDVKRKVAAV